MFIEFLIVDFKSSCFNFHYSRVENLMADVEEVFFPFSMWGVFVHAHFTFPEDDDLVWGREKRIDVNSIATKSSEGSGEDSGEEMKKLSIFLHHLGF